MYWNYVSCCLTVVSTLLVGKRLWHGWILAGINSAIICLIGFQTRQWGFIPANLFCLAIYAHNIRKWRGQEKPSAADVALPIAEASAGAGVRPQVIAIDSRLPIEALPAKAPLEDKARRFRKSGSAKRARFHRLRAALPKSRGIRLSRSY